MHSNIWSNYQLLKQNGSWFNQVQSRAIVLIIPLADPRFGGACTFVNDSAVVLVDESASAVRIIGNAGMWNLKP
jgi:hypothetical protein